MSNTALLCPRCGSPAPPRVDMPPWGYVDRYTCDACGLTTLREELVPERNLNILVGEPPGVAGITGLIDTLSASVQEDFAPAADNITTSFSTRALSNLSVSPQRLDSVEFSATVGWTNTAQGPDDALWYLDWREGSGSFTTVGPLQVLGDFNPHTISSGQVSTNASGGAWTAAVINSLEVRVRAVTDANGTQNATDIFVDDYFAAINGST